MNHQVRFSTKHQVVAVPAHPSIATMFNEAKQITLDGKPFLAIDHNPASTFLLRKLGFEVPAPTMHYSFPGEAVPFDVQKKTVDHLVMNIRAYCLNAMGTGKTKAALWAWDYLYQRKLTGKLIVFAPLSTLSVVWGAEILATLPHRTFAIVHGTKAKRLEALGSDVDIYVINHDGHKVLFKELTTRFDIKHVIIDELAVYRNPSERTKLMVQFALAKDWVWGMTGSPIPTSPTDVFCQAKIVTPGTVPNYFRLFRDKLMYKVGQFKWLPKPNAIDGAYEALQPAVRYTLDDVVELPDVVERFIDVPMGKHQEKIYTKLFKDAHALAMRGEIITAANAGGIMSKLMQISAGWVYASDGRTAALDNSERITALIDAIEGTANKILVFATFKHATDGINKALIAAGYDDDQHIVVTGDTPAGERNRIFTAFQKTDKYRILVAHPQCLAHGLTLTRADTIVWFNPTTNLEIYEQANQRIRRIGQKHKQLILHFQGSKVERHVYRLLANKQSIQSSLLDLFKTAT